MTKSELLDIIASPSSVDKDVLRDLQDYVKEYPYSQTFRMLYLKGLDNTQDVRYGNELKTTSLYVTDRRNLYRFISDKPQAQVKEQRQNSISLREVPKMETESVDAGDKTEAVAPSWTFSLICKERRMIPCRVWQHLSMISQNLS